MLQSLVTEVSPRETKKEDKRARLAEAAWAAFRQRGVAATTTAAVARAAGVAKGTLFLYASDKDDLVFLVMHDRLQRASEAAFAELPRGPLVPQLVHLFGRLYELYEQSGEVGRRFVQVLPGAGGLNAARVNALTQAFVLRVAALVVEAQARGEVRRDVEPLLVAQVAFGLYFMSLMAWLQGFMELRALREGLLSQSLDLMMRGIGAAR